MRWYYGIDTSGKLMHMTVLWNVCLYCSETCCRLLVCLKKMLKNVKSSSIKYVLYPLSVLVNTEIKVLYSFYIVVSVHPLINITLQMILLQMAEWMGSLHNEDVSRIHDHQHQTLPPGESKREGHEIRICFSALILTVHVAYLHDSHNSLMQSKAFKTYFNEYYNNDQTGLLQKKILFLYIQKILTSNRYNLPNNLLVIDELKQMRTSVSLSSGSLLKLKKERQ